ncbi:Transcription factor bye1 [Podochytrium sp. JEL0797]|nr:Transcription factor bye1 [Podochytrium sp. JEL0797]
MAWIHDKTRSLVRKSFGDLLRGILEDLGASPGSPTTPVEGGEEGEEEGVKREWLNVDELVHSMEDELFDFTADGVKGSKRVCGDKYKSKFRSLQFNLKDKKNSTLRTRLLRGQLPPHSLVRLEANDLANDEIKAKSHEIRILSLHNAIKPKDVEGVLKKTHKGEEEVKPKREGGAVAAMEGVVSDSESVRESTPPPVAFMPASIARLVAQAEADAKASAKIVAPPRIESLDDLLAKMEGKSPTGTKRGGEEDVAVKVEKKGRLDVDAGDAMESVVTGSWENLGVSDSWASFDAGASGADADDSWMREGMEESSFSPSAQSPRESPAPEDAPAVWTGTVRMPQVAKFSGSCRQIAGRSVGSSSQLWEALLPPTVMVEGRIDMGRTHQYVAQQKLSTSKEIIAVEFVAEETPDTDMNGVTVPSAEGGFAELLEYFLSKQRYAVVGGRYVMVRDMYLVPVRAGETVPQTITVLSKFNVSDKTDAGDRLFGVMILDKAFFGSSAAAGSGAANSSVKRASASSSLPSKRVSSGPNSVPVKREPARDPRARPPSTVAAPPPPQPTLPTTTVPAWAATLSQFAKQETQHTAAPLGILPPAPSATALALLMQLQMQQQKNVAPSAAAAPPAVTAQGLAGLLSHIQAQSKQQQQYGGGASVGSSLYGSH